MTPLTVLRWELPDGNKEARRPRRAMVEALEKLAAAEPSASIAPAASAGQEDADLSADLELLRPIRELLESGGHQRAQDELFGLLASNRLSPAGRALATLDQVQWEQLARFDVRGTLTAVMPLIADVEAGRLPRAVAARVHVVAALLFGAPDARIFDPGRVNLHAAAADALLAPNDDDRALLMLAKQSSARFLGLDVFRGMYAEARTLRPSSPFRSCILDLLRAIGAEIVGDLEVSRELGQSALLRAAELGLQAVVVGALANQMSFALRRCVPASQILVLGGIARHAMQEGQVGPIETAIRVVANECEALTRLTRFEEARAAAKEARQMAARAGVPPYVIAGPEARLACHTNDQAALASLAAALDTEVAPSMKTLVRSTLLFVRSCQASLRGEYETAAELAAEAYDDVEMVASAEFIAHDIIFECMISRALSGDAPAARRCLRRVEALMDRRPSPYHAGWARRAEGMLELFEGRPENAVKLLEASMAPCIQAEDLTSTVLIRGAIALARESMGIAGAAGEFASLFAETQRLGIVARPMARKRPEGGRPGALPPAGPSRYPLADQLSAAADDLLARQARPDVVKRELVRIAEELFPGRAVVEDGGERASSSAAGPIEHWFEITEPGGKPLRLGVGGKVDERELEGLRELTSAARRGLTASIARASEPSAYADEPDVLPELPDFVAAAPVMRELRRSIAKLSGSRSTILINGESGAGKEVVARAIHDLSARARRPYIAFNCASVPRDLFEGQLFGHKKGAFTGAHADNLGVIRAAEKGTLFLDEIGELPLDVQPKLLRFFENGEVFPLGERASIKVDVRVVAATHRDLAELVRQGLFREDLFYRLNVVPLRVPPLRDRPEDVIALSKRFVAKFAREDADPPELSEDALVSLTDYAWPGNVRELRNVLERTMAFTSTSTVLTSSDLRFA